MWWGVLPSSARLTRRAAATGSVASRAGRLLRGRHFTRCSAMPFPRHRSLTSGLSPRLRTPQGQLFASRYVSRRTIFRSGALPAEISPRVGTIFLGLIGLGFISTMIGVSVCLLVSSAFTLLSRIGRYEFYSSFAIWPEEVRADLRAGVKAKQQGNLALSRKLLTQYVHCVSLLNCY